MTCSAAWIRGALEPMEASAACLSPRRGRGYLGVARPRLCSAGRGRVHRGGSAPLSLSALSVLSVLVLGDQRTVSHRGAWRGMHVATSEGCALCARSPCCAVGTACRTPRHRVSAYLRAYLAARNRLPFHLALTRSAARLRRLRRGQSMCRRAPWPILPEAGAAREKGVKDSERGPRASPPECVA